MADLAGMVLSALKLKKFYGPVEALSSFSLSLEAGEFLCLVGPDGAAKSTALRLLCGLEKPDSGEIELFGRRVTRFSSDLRARLGYLPQGFSLYEDLSIEENLVFFAELYGVSNYRSLVASLLDFTRLEPFRDRLAGRLSGGMKQKLALACTLVHEPDILLLDEPTTGVDPVSRRDFWQILFRLQQQGKSILMTTPYLDEAERASRVAFILQGRIMACGRPEKIKAEFPARLVEIVSPHSRHLQRELKLWPGLADLQLFGDRLHLVLAEGYELRKLKEELSRLDCQILSLTEISPSLENVFMFLMSREKESIA
ncbi:MAG: putative ABC transporter ATP-binding protein [Candidatus Saccharicenans subterraneus]|uniref:Putative ABC transporter ATP-binding protein n=1 Tax=Candidatus Saccharicenans subterraneus TaxID=2508984 RepID=A0A3E2BMD2_9BACT|nr:MAG: putative ABC transporter ATP-binding protein [Candidatus Saccharicenans subterraneum]